FVNYVRERKEASVYVMVSSQHTGSGGRRYILNFIGQNGFQNKNDTLAFNTRKDATDDIVRNKMQKYLKIGLMPYIAHSSIAKNIEINYRGESAEEIIKKDNWDNWVFSIQVSGDMDSEESSQDYDADLELEAERITKEWKIETEFDYRYNREVYDTDDETITAIRSRYQLGGLAVKSLGDHFSIGLFNIMGANKYSNLNFYFRTSPAIEYNFFPYEESNLRQLCLRYYIGYRYNNYIETTIYNKNEEYLPGQNFSIDLEYKRRWGEISVFLEASNYFPDFDKNRFTLYNSFNLNLFKGLSLYLGGSASLIHDQVSLAKESVTKEERLLQIKEIQTDYSYSLRIGFEYTFGSIYNNVVNPRF
ncbi:MAG: DUF481 domain-containing protein, partial [Candidatus Marinimicrobia bacterium]|nr:DUF481 domain-containing protein [Candidatus Neomarinimicrobiota bacterium]